MIERYSLKKMSSVWSLENRFTQMLRVEKAVAQVQGHLKIIPPHSAQSIVKKGKFSLKNILKKEKEVQHDVIAFISDVAQNVGSEGKYVHYGLTSSDVLDTALSLQIESSQVLLNQSLKELKKILKEIIRKHKNSLCAGRTHGVHAESTTFGFKLLGHFEELKRVETSLNESINQALIGKISGAVGTYSQLSEEVEKKVCKKLNLKAEAVSTQVIPRDRHARVLFSLSLLGSFLERLSIELRHLQRTEVGEVCEGFSSGQRGSSAMPHKKNPISAENITGVARLLRSYVSPSLENISLWHERDISHSSVERVLFPDAFILSDYALNRMISLLKNLKVYPEKMKQNMELSQGLLFSSQVLTALVSKGLDREKAYQLVQKISHSLKPKDHFITHLKKQVEIKKYLNQKDLDILFSGKKQQDSLSKKIESLLK